ncbi:MAG: lytic transglycosylase domain-containing protein, partial [Micrococcales bacterium]|nr:lytic transglycosylase domain-containing protein [Micrococcales bacterium]
MAAVAGMLAAGAAVPASANSSAAEYFRARATSSNVPELLSNSDRDWYRALFAAIDAHDWAKVQAMFAERPDGPLHQIARAEYILDPDSPKIEASELQDWLGKGVDLPQAEQIASLGAKRGVASIAANSARYQSR